MLLGVMVNELGRTFGNRMSINQLSKVLKWTLRLRCVIRRQ